MMNEEDDAFNHVEMLSRVKQENVKAQLDKPKREWVGLTHDERLEILVNAMYHKWDDYKIVSDIEAKLKEKNT